MSQPPFKVIIAGGSVAGLTLANALEKAGIDYLLLERGDIAPQLGASISIFCHTSRVFEQLGMREEFRGGTAPILRRLNFDEQGRLFDDCPLLGSIAERTGRPVVFMERRAYIQMLYDNLADKSRVRGRVGLVGFSEDDEGVTVRTSDGEKVRGSILVGADGIHSTVRGIMAESVAGSDPRRAAELNEGFTSQYRTIFGISKNQRKDDPDTPLVPEGTAHIRYHRGASGVSAVGVSGLVFWFLFVREDEPSRTPGCPRYSDFDAEETMRRYGRLGLGPDYTFDDLWELRVKAAMVPLEEGTVEGGWNSGGRVVLLGDSVSKATINAGLGGNTSVEGACHLVNELLPVLKRTRVPSKQEIKAVFERYEEKQRPRAKACTTISGYITRFEAMETWWLRILRVILPWVPGSLRARGFMEYVAGAPMLEFLPDPDKSTL